MGPARSLVGTILVALTLQACATTDVKTDTVRTQLTPEDAVRTQLTPEEVQNVFIGTPWYGPNGAFLFRKNGTYTYKRFDRSSPRGTWSYEMLANGKLSGSSTDYTFYRLKDGRYQYFHSRSGRYYPARPNKPPFL